MITTETVMLSLGREHAHQLFLLRRAYRTGSIVRTNLVKHKGPVRIVDYSETYRDGCFEISVAVRPEAEG